MRNLVHFMHASLDGFVAISKGEMNRITADVEMLDFASILTWSNQTLLIVKKFPSGIIALHFKKVSGK